MWNVVLKASHLLENLHLGWLGGLSIDPVLSGLKMVRCYPRQDEMLGQIDGTKQRLVTCISNDRKQIGRAAWTLELLNVPVGETDNGRERDEGKGLSEPIAA